jgi:hypothetical protein
MIESWRRAVILLAICSSVKAFSLVPSQVQYRGATTLRLPRLHGTAAPCIHVDTILDRFFQLQELEDKEECTTEIIFRSGGDLRVGMTTGPVFAQATGKWSYDAESNDFQMLLTRTYEAGRSKTTETEIGEFSFAVTRIFRGDVVLVGGSTTAMSGLTYDYETVSVGNVQERQVGFFNIIDTTNDRKGLTDEEWAQKMAQGMRSRKNTPANVWGGGGETAAVATTAPSPNYVVSVEEYIKNYKWW